MSAPSTRRWACHTCGYVLTFVTRIAGIERPAAWLVTNSPTPPIGNVGEAPACPYCGSRGAWVEVPPDVVL